MPFHRFVALRYLVGAQGREEGHRFLRFITYVAIGGVAIGVATLLLALAIVRGFSREIEAKIVGFGAHVQVENIRHAPLDNAAVMLDGIRGLDAVERAQPVVSEFALLRRSQTEIDGVSVWGTDALPAYLSGAIIKGSGELNREEAGEHRLVIGSSLARSLGLGLGDRVTVFSTRNMAALAGGEASLLAARPRAKQFDVTGIYETFLADFDETYVFTTLAVARSLLDYAPDEVTRLDLTLHDPAEAGAIAANVEETFGFPVMARTIFQVYRGLFAWVNLQEAIIPFVIGVMIIVAAFNIVGTLLMVIMEKTREIGVMASMGASRRSIQRLFLWLGLFVGAAGTVLGLGVALVLALTQQRYDLIPLPAEAYYMSTAPVALNPFDFLIVGAISLVLCVLASYIPARFAARIDPLKVIRFS